SPSASRAARVPPIPRARRREALKARPATDQLKSHKKMPRPLRFGELRPMRGEGHEGRERGLADERPGPRHVPPRADVQDWTLRSSSSSYIDSAYGRPPACFLDADASAASISRRTARGGELRRR